MRRAVEYIPRAERNREERRRRAEQEVTYVIPKTGTEAVIQGISKQYDGIIREHKAVEVGDAVNDYQNIRNLRHDLWIDLFNDSVLKRHYRIGDILVKDFVKQNFPELEPHMPEGIKNLTPDILIVDPNDGIVILGDVAVARSVDLSNRKKYFKYYEIQKFFETHNIRLRHENLIISDDLKNYRQELQKFQDMDIIRVSTSNLIRIRNFHSVCQRLMDLIPRMTVDNKLFSQRLDQIDKIEPETFDIDIDQNLINFDLIELDPDKTEDEIIEMIKEEVEKDKYDKFFDNDVNDSITAFNKLVIGNMEKEHMKPKSTLKVVNNSLTMEIHTNHDLIDDYIMDLHFGEEGDTRDYILHLLPTRKQNEIMKKIYNNKENGRKATSEDKEKRVYGPHQYSRLYNANNRLVVDLNDKLTYGKKRRNEKTSPKTINPDEYPDCISYVNSMIKYYGNTSIKPHFLDDSWDAKSNFETDNSKLEYETYRYVKGTNGAQLAHSLSNLYHRIMHTSTNLGMRDNIFVAPNSSFICIIPKNHSPTNTKNCDLPMIFLSRIEKNNKNYDEIINGNEYAIIYKTERYTYLVSQLCRFNIDKMSHWDQAGYKLVSSCTYLLTECKELLKSKEKVVGIITLLSLDGHQKISEYLDLLKYIAYMPFSDISRLSKLIEDKMDLLIKTRMDVWLLFKMRDFIIELSKEELLNAIKPKLRLFNGLVTRESLGLSIELPSFIDNTIRHKTVNNFIEEMSMVYIVRPKQLYGSQFMDKSIYNTATWNLEYEQEIEKFGNWLTTGKGDNYPFESKFAFSQDAIIYAQRYFQEVIAPHENYILRKISKTAFNQYMHNNCSLRGCVKDEKYRRNNIDIHSTSMEECLKYYKEKDYKDRECTAIGVAEHFLKTNKKMEYSMSEKEQRGGGRPIATPTLGAKACLMMIEKPEQAIGTYTKNNIIVEGKHKLKEQSDAYKLLISEGATTGYKQVYQLTEDQSKFSENDNTRKYYPYISNNKLLPLNVRKLQKICLDRLTNREHLVKRLPIKILEDKNLYKYVNYQRNGIRVNIGWPQGMLNFISTSIHSIADYWITYAYNKAYPNNQVLTKGLVHSDDSWLAIACNDVKTFKKFVLFRTMAKKLFCLKLNDKKVWGSKYLGELVSNYNINGNVHLSVAKTLANSFGNLIYQNWVMDVHTQVSSIQQAYRNGANIPTLIMLSTILRQQMITSYQIKEYHLEHIHKLPIEMGGYPDTSAFELGVTGVTSFYKKIINQINHEPHSNINVLILKTLNLSIMYNIDKERGTAYSIGSNKTELLKRIEDDDNLDIKDFDYQSVTIPSKGEVFSCIKHIMPKSKKIASTIKQIEDLPFETDGLEMIVTNPKDLATSLGHLKGQTSTLLYKLAAEKYTNNTKRLAISQAIQSSGKVVRVADSKPMTMNEMYWYLFNYDIAPADPKKMEISLNDETEISDIAEGIVNVGDYSATNIDKRKIINRMPNVEDKFSTICDLKTVLLHIIDSKLNTNLVKLYGDITKSIDILRKDAELIQTRFAVYFQFYNCKYACNLIMQQYLYRTKTRLWMQPYLNNENVEVFLCELYGKTVNKDFNYKVSVNLLSRSSNKRDQGIINTIYTVLTLNSIYESKFELHRMYGKPIKEILDGIDYAGLSLEDYLKYSLLQKIYNNNDFYLKDYDDKKIYDQIYLVKQEFKNGVWSGPFTCVVRYGHTVIKISGEPEKISLTANRPNVSDILEAMCMFVKLNFKEYSYSTKTKWHNCGFWKTTDLFSKLYLTPYNSVTTMIGTTRNNTSTAITIDDNLQMPITYNNTEADEYIFKEHYRLVYKMINNKEYKVGSIAQNMKCPYLDHCELLPDFIDGLPNDVLLKTKIIIHITTRKFYNCNKSDLISLLNERTPSLSSRCLANFTLRFIDNFGDLNMNIEPVQYTTMEEIEQIDITGLNAINFLEKHETTTPEDLTFIDVNYIYEDESRTGSIYKFTNLTRLVCNMIVGNLTELDIKEIISQMCINNELMKKVVELLDYDKEQVDEFCELAYEICEIIEVDIDILAFILGSELDDDKYWKTIDMRDIVKNCYHYCTNKNNVILGRKIANNINKHIFEIDDTEEEIRDILLKRMVKK